MYGHSANEWPVSCSILSAMMRVKQGQQEPSPSCTKRRSKARDYVATFRKRQHSRRAGISIHPLFEMSNRRRKGVASEQLQVPFHIVTTSKDKHVRLYDPRQSSSVLVFQWITDHACSSSSELESLSGFAVLSFEIPVVPVQWCVAALVLEASMLLQDMGWSG